MPRTRRARESGTPPIVDFTWTDEAGNVLSSDHPRVTAHVAKAIARFLVRRSIEHVRAGGERGLAVTRKAAARDPSHTMKETEVAALLGVTVGAARDAVASNAIPRRCVGREIVFSRRRILTWLNER